MRGAANRLLRQSAALQGALRGYASEVAVVEDSAFLKYSNPFPQTFNYNAALATLPQTKVRGGTAAVTPRGRAISLGAKGSEAAATAEAAG